MKQLDTVTAADFANRLRKVLPNSTPRWGSLSPEALMPHLRCMIEISLEEQTQPDFSVPFSKTFLFRWAILYLPWPKGTRAPETLFPPAGDAFDEEREKLIAAMNRFADACTRAPRRKTRSPLLGPVTLADWARIHAKHLEHHLKQFGC